MNADDLTTNIAAHKLRADAVAVEANELAEQVAQLAEAATQWRKDLFPQGITTAASLTPEGPTVATPLVGDWDAMTTANKTWLDGQGLADVTLDDLLTPEQLDELERLDAKGRERWSVGDFVTVGGCAVIGLLATAFDDQIDAAVKNELGGLRQTGLFRHFEDQGKNLPIDYTGLWFGGPGHRVRSPGHDIARPFEALRQIRSGTFTGTYWDDGQQYKFLKPGYQPHDLPEALVLWLMHLGADLVTTTSLPLPWWSKLYECDTRDLRNLAHCLYNPAGQPGLNVRSMFISKALPVITTELVVGTKVHLDARSLTGQVGPLSGNQCLRRDEMLLAAHACTGLAATGKVAVVASTGAGPLALRHLNVSAVARAGFLGFKVAREHRRRAETHRAPTWDDLLLRAPLPWQLEDLAGGQPCTN